MNLNTTLTLQLHVVTVVIYYYCHSQLLVWLCSGHVGVTGGIAGNSDIDGPQRSVDATSLD